MRTAWPRAVNPQNCEMIINTCCGFPSLELEVIRGGRKQFRAGDWKSRVPVPARLPPKCGILSYSLITSQFLHLFNGYNISKQGYSPFAFSLPNPFSPFSIWQVNCRDSSSLSSVCLVSDIGLCSASERYLQEISGQEKGGRGIYGTS